MSRVLVQCGDVLENRLRVLALAERLRAWGVEPVVAVYTRAYAALFDAFGIETVPLFEYRNPTAKLDRAHRFPFALDELDPAPLERATAALAGTRFDAGAAMTTMRRALVAVDRIVERKRIDRLVVWNGYTGAVANALRCYATATRADRKSVV